MSNSGKRSGSAAAPWTDDLVGSTKRTSGAVKFYGAQVLFWALYLPLVPFHGFAVWMWRTRYGVSVGVAVRMTYRNAVKTGVVLTRLVRNPAQGLLFLRSSWMLTPASIPLFPGAPPRPADPTVERQNTTINWDDIRSRVYERDDYTCLNCGVQGRPSGDAELHADHVEPVSTGGSNSLSNLRTLCRGCHEARHGRRFD